MTRPSLGCAAALLLAFLVSGASLAVAQAGPSALKKNANTAANKKKVASKPSPRPKKVVERVKPQPKARQNQKIEKIIIQGNKKIEQDAIRAKLVSREGVAYSEERVRDDIKELFALGYFYNIEADLSEGAAGVK